MVGALPATANSGTIRYVALGDSYAAGQGAPPYDLDTACKRSSKGYPALLAAEKHVRLEANETCSGAKTADVAKQLLALNPAQTRLVTLTVGANDLDVSGVARTCIATPAKCEEAILDARTRLTQLGSDLTDMYAQVANEAPKALIVVTGYPQLLEPTAPLDPNLISAFRLATDALNATIRQAVAAQAPGVNIVYVDVTAAFEGHGIGGSKGLFINPSGADAFHPNAAGYVAYADAISAQLPDAWLDKQKQLA
jgi:lysophospholipase L1-like esterase